MDIDLLVEKLIPIITDRLSQTPSFYGNKDRFYIGSNVKLGNAHFNLSSGDISIGDNSFFGYSCSVITGSHYYQRTGRARHRYPKKGNNISIGKGVWIGSGAIILGPCSIGDNSVIAAGAVVLPGEYDSDSLYVGIPAKLKRKIL
jgi:acetyltransferase-like isoleucine patch superfamily enzyme